VRFEEEEPFCSIFPIRMQPVIECEPQVRRLSDNPVLMKQHESFRTARDEFMARLGRATLARPSRPGKNITLSGATRMEPRWRST
jgi:hypothetical protein